MNEQALLSFDRREGDLAVLVDEEGISYPVPLTALPENSREGMMFRRMGDTFVADEDAAEVRRRRVLELQNRLRRRK
ncbi:MAG: DUF3006 domain-containing protein [Clostridia bacterium]|nr:DUF3006 domain-containing protein [Clostridia bacterium]